MTIRVLLVDDEPVARRGLRQRLRSEEDMAIVGECGDGIAAIAAIAELRPDLVFLDIQMPGLGGFDVIDAVGLERMPTVIFVTAFDQFAVRAFDVHALDYVLKPVDGERFHRALDRARRHIREPGDKTAERIAAALKDLGLGASRRWAKRLAVKSTGRVLLVELRDVDRIDAAGNYVEIRVGSKTHLLRETLTHLEARLDPERFARVSRASIVNIERVRELQPMFNGDFVVVLKDGSEVPGSRRYRESIDRFLG
ncbi:MAG: response regulator [Xanthomonadaceae bacterium]|nr:response regulator [Xanthomonadaceae bacterium]